MTKVIKFSIICLSIFLVFTIIAPALAAGFISEEQATADQTKTGGFLPDEESGKGTCPEGYNGNCGNYSLNDMMSVALIVSNYILGIVGSLALLAFVVGGMMWILSAGNAELVTRGKQTIIGAVVGLAIVFTSFMIIQLVYTALGIPKADKGGWAVSSWFK